MIQDFFTTKIFTILFIMLSSYHLSNHNCINQWKYCKFFKMSMYGFWLAWSISHKMYSITCKKAWGYKIISNQFWGFTVHHKVLCKYFVFANIFIFKVGFQGFFSVWQISHIKGHLLKSTWHFMRVWILFKMQNPKDFRTMLQFC